MESKKSKKANLEKGWWARVQLGLIVAVSLSLVAFEWLSYEVDMEFSSEGITASTPLEIEIPPKPRLPEPEKPKQTQRTKPPQTFKPDMDIKEMPDDSDKKVTFEFEIDPDVDIDPIDVPTDGPTEVGPVDWGGGTPPLTAGDVDELPEFIGSLPEFLGNNLRYPEAERAIGRERKMQVIFTVDKDGNVTDVVIHNSRGESDNFEKEAIRVMKKMPKWKPGKLNGQDVPVKLVLPIRFSLQ